jgi:UDP:flavonoid glycosyltransferase YjiC (YdhE family)
VRFLFGFVGGMGHLAPQLPIARALVAAGHDVAFSTYFPMVADVAAAGFAAFATGPQVAKPPVTKPLLEPDPEREDEVARRVFAGRLTSERMASVPEHIEAFRPGALVCDDIDFGAQIAAGRLGLPFATVLTGTTGAFPRRETVAAALAAMPAPPDLVLSGFPPGLRSVPLPHTAHTFRPCEPGRSEGDAIYFTLGTIFIHECGDLPDRVLAGLEGFEVIETITRFVPQADVLPRCRAVISHGGSGTFVATLAHGLPSVLIPLGADQLVNAERAAELGVARVLPAVDATPDDVREAVLDVIEDPAYAAAARAVRDEIAALPGPESAVQPLTRLQSRRVIET